MVVMPGFINTHQHTWQAPLRNIGSDWMLGQYLTGIHFGMSKYFRPQDTCIGNLLGTIAAETHAREQDRVKLTCRDVIKFATIQGARACGLEAKTGSLTPGKEADVILVRADSLAMWPITNPAGAIVYSGHTGLVDRGCRAGSMDDGRVAPPASEAGHETSMFRLCNNLSADIGNMKFT
jgi:cytosine/adenosine deaminase-related metal-dependent hydrolase